MDLQLTGRRALVCASSRGLGFAIAKALAAEGTELCLCARDSGRLAQAAATIQDQTKNPKVIWEPYDLRHLEGAQDFIDRVTQRLGGPVEIFIHNTGGPKIGPGSALSLKDWRDGFTQALLSAVALNQAVLPGMRSAGYGRILSVASLAAVQPLPGFVLSASLRAGLMAYLKCLSAEVAREGITVNTLLPGILGDTGKSNDDNALNETRARALAMIPMGRFGKPEELASLVAFLASPHASYMTGLSIPVEGGMKKAVT